MKRFTLPLTDEEIMGLEAGDIVLLSGTVYTARDAAHKRLAELIAEGKELPFDIKGSAIYYLGPTPARPGNVIGSAGPTSSYRMDPYTPELLSLGLKVIIGKGKRAESVTEALKENRAVYLAAVGGAAALLYKSIKASEVIAFEDLGTEAIRKLELEDFPAVVAIDAHGRDQYKLGPEKFRK